MVRALFAMIAFLSMALTPAYAAPGDITVAEYLEAWESMDTDALQKELEETGTIDFDKHPKAKFVTEEIGATAKAYRAKVEADREAGRPPHSCLPEAEAQLSSEALLPHLQSYDPEARKKVTLAEALADLMLQTYPCD